MAGIDWNAPIPTGGGSHQSVEEMFPEVFGGTTRSASAPPRSAASVPEATSPARPEPVASAPLASKPYEENMSWGDYAKGTLQNAPQSAARVGKGLYEAVTNPSETANALGALAAGAISKANTALGGHDRSPEGEAMIDALIGDIEKRWSNPSQSFYEDPFGIGMDVASVAPVIGAAGKVSGLGAVGRGLERVASLGDPVNLALQGAKVGSKAVLTPIKGLTRYGQGMASGVPQSMLKIADEAGQGVSRGARDAAGNLMTDAERAALSAAQRRAFTEFAMGRGDHRDIAKAAMDAVEELRQKASSQYVSAKQALSTQPLQMGEIRNALDKLKNDIDPHRLGLFPQLRNSIAEMERQIMGAETSANPAARSAEGLDRLKRSLNDIVREYRGTQHVGAFAEVPKAVRNTIARADSGYAQMMERWEQWRNELLDFQKTLGTNDKVAESSRLAKLLSSAKKGDRMSLLRELASKTQSGQVLPFMIAGATMENALPPYLQVFGLGALGSVAAGGLHGAGAAAMGSPRLAGMTQYGLGRLQGAISGAKAPPAIATNILSQVGQDRTERKSGGRVGVNHDKLAEQLVGAAERAKKGISKSTEPLLNMPDDHVAHALEVANRSI